jgi:hypothetical protein|tara:strand:- start:3318 stop:3689 length:372 start_codon:yes stop_codon:yes gene_type:complete
MANFKSAILTTGTYTGSSTSQVALITPMDVKNEDRLSFQFINNDTTPSNKDTLKVWGRLAFASGTLGATSEGWTQIGDDVVVSGSASALKSISTTGLYWVGVTINPTATHASLSHDWSMLRQA